MNILLTTVVKHFLKLSVVRGKLTKGLIEDDPTGPSNQLALPKIDFGAETMKEGSLLHLLFVYLMKMHACLFILKKIFLYLLLY